MDLDTTQKIIGIIGGLVTIAGTLFGIWRDWPKVQERSQKRVSTQRSNNKALRKPVFNKIDLMNLLLIRGVHLFLGGVGVFIIGSVLSRIGIISYTLFFSKSAQILTSGGSLLVGVGFLLSVFEDDDESKVSNLLMGLLCFGIGFLSYSYIPQLLGYAK